MSFFPTAENWIAEHGFEAYVDRYGKDLDDRLWADVHNSAFGFRPRQPWNYPAPEHIEDACDIVYKMISDQIAMDRRVKLANQYVLEKRIAAVMQANGMSYYEALTRVMHHHECIHESTGPRNGIADEGRFCYKLGLDYGLEPMFRHIMKRELSTEGL